MFYVDISAIDELYTVGVARGSKDANKVKFIVHKFFNLFFF